MITIMFPQETGIDEKIVLDKLFMLISMFPNDEEEKISIVLSGSNRNLCALLMRAALKDPEFCEILKLAALNSSLMHLGIDPLPFPFDADTTGVPPEN